MTTTRLGQNLSSYILPVKLSWIPNTIASFWTTVNGLHLRSADSDNAGN
jgi:hypothetical protein